MQTFLWLFGFFVLVYTGFESIVKAGDSQTTRNRKNAPLYKSFLTGFVMSLFNPLSILFWLGIYGSVLTTTVKQYGTEQVLIYSSAIFIGIFLWDVTMATISSIFKKYFAEKFLKLLSIISGLFLIIFGVYFGYQGIKALFF